MLCVGSSGWLRGEPILPELLKQNRVEYVAALKAADDSFVAGNLDLTVLHALVSRLLDQQINSINVEGPAANNPSSSG